MPNQSTQKDLLLTFFLLFGLLPGFAFDPGRFAREPQEQERDLQSSEYQDFVVFGNPNLPNAQDPYGGSPDASVPGDSSTPYSSQQAQNEAPQPPIRLGEKNVRVGRIPYLSLREMMRQVGPLFAFLKKKTGVREVRLVTARDYSGVLEALERGTIDFAWVGPMAFVKAREKMGLIPLVKTNRPEGIAYRGAFITLKGGEVLGLDDVRGKSIGFVDPESSSGYLFPLYLLQRININPHHDCSKVLFLKKHDAVLEAVLSGTVAVGVCLEAAITDSKDPRVRDRILVLGRTDEIPSDVLVCRKDCPPNLREAFSRAFLGPTPPAARKKMRKGEPPHLDFVPAVDEDFLVVRSVWEAVRSTAFAPQDVGPGE